MEFSVARYCGGSLLDRPLIRPEIDDIRAIGEEIGYWARKDSNLRRQSHQIYSLTRETVTAENVDTSGGCDNSLSPGLPVNAKNQPEIDADLRLVVDRWADLPADVRKMIVGVVRATAQASKP
jgi:hypothetical protein